MKHRVGYNRLGRKPSHRKALHRNMVTSLFRHERIQTTRAKAQAIRRTAEKMITRAKLDSVHNRRMVGRDIKDKSILAKLFTEIAPRFNERPGGYTRVLKLGFRKGDASQMVLLELVERDGVEQTETQKARKAKKAERRAAPKETSESVTVAEAAVEDTADESEVDAEIKEPAVSEEETATTDETSEPEETVSEADESEKEGE